MRQFFLAIAFLSSTCCQGLSQTQTAFDLRGKTQTLHVYGSGTKGSIILSSGDLGWAGLVVHVAESLSSQGYRVIGFDSRTYLSSFTSKNSLLSPQDVPRDFKCLVDFMWREGQPRPVLAGVSEGAGLSVLAATEPEIQQSIQGVLGLGLPNRNELGWRWRDFTIWLTKKVPSEPTFLVEKIIHGVAPVPLAEIHSTHDEFLPLEEAKALLSLAREPKRMWVIESSNHRFSENRAELDRSILEALEWIQKSR